MKNTDLTQLNTSSKNTMMETLGIEYTQVGEDFICGKMPVDNRTHQPMGIMHGGASAALIETLGSIGSHLLIDSETEFSSGLDLNINHIRAVRSGFVHGKATNEANADFDSFSPTRCAAGSNGAHCGVRQGPR